jgi:hypothetical protein
MIIIKLTHLAIQIHQNVFRWVCSHSSMAKVWGPFGIWDAKNSNYLPAQLIIVESPITTRPVMTKHEICSQTGWWPSTNAPTTVQDPSYNWTVGETKTCSIFSKIQTNNLHDYVDHRHALYLFLKYVHLRKKGG